MNLGLIFPGSSTQNLKVAFFSRLSTAANTFGRQDDHWSAKPT